MEVKNIKQIPCHYPLNTVVLCGVHRYLVVDGLRVGAQLEGHVEHLDPVEDDHHVAHVVPVRVSRIGVSPLRQYEPGQFPRNGLSPHQNHYVQDRIYNMSIGDFMYMGPK